MATHKNVPISQIHVPYSFSYASSTERNAATNLTIADIGKFARQLNDNTLYMLVNNSPTTWTSIGSGVAGGGSSDELLEENSIVINASSYSELEIENQCNRGLVHYLKVTCTGTVTNSYYDICFYSKNVFTDANLLYKAENVEAFTDYIDALPFWIIDDSETNTVYVKIINKSNNQITFNLIVKYEKFG